MPVRLLQDLHVSGRVFPKGAEVDLDSMGVDQKSAIAEGLAEPINKVRSAKDEADLNERLEALERENAELKARLGDEDEDEETPRRGPGRPKRMDQKAAEPVKVETGTNRPRDNA
jgi:hypothetical protein